MADDGGGLRPPDDLDALLRTAKRSTTFANLDAEDEAFLVKTLAAIEAGNGVQLLIAARKPGGGFRYIGINTTRFEAFKLALDTAERIGGKIIS